MCVHHVCVRTMWTQRTCMRGTYARHDRLAGHRTYEEAGLVLTADVAIVGAGAAGLSLAHRLAPHPPAARPVSVALVNAPPGALRPPPRTWCFWEPGAGPYDAALTASWQRLRVHAPGGQPIPRGIAPLRYKMLRSHEFHDLI